jgi:hypothetical protein
VAILVSNDQYRLGRALGSGTRPRLDAGALGITVLAPEAVDGTPRPGRRLGLQQWTVESFEIGSDGPVAAGIDGEATHLDAPLQFETRPGALRVRVAPQHPGASPSALQPDRPWEMIGALVRFALHGGPPGLSRA